MDKFVETKIYNKMFHNNIEYKYTYIGALLGVGRVGLQSLFRNHNIQ